MVRRRTNESTCVVHQGTDVDVNEVVFQLSQMVVSELNPMLISFAFKLSKYHADHKGGLPEEITSHENSSVLTQLLQPETITRLQHLRAEYMMELLIAQLANRHMYLPIDLCNRIKKHKDLFYDIDFVCGSCDAGVVASVYGAAVQALIKQGSFKISDVTDSVAVGDKGNKNNSKESVSAADPSTSLETGTLTSQKRLSEYGIRMDFQQDDDASTSLKSCEALLALRATITANMTMTCRNLCCHVVTLSRCTIYVFYFVICPVCVVLLNYT